MHRKQLSHIVGLLLGIFCLFSGGWQANAAEKTYVIGTDVTYAPFEYADNNGDYKGIDIDILKAIAKEENIKFDIKPLGFNASVQAAEAGQINGIMAGMMVTEERKQKFDFSDPYYKTGVVMAVAKDSQIKSLADTKGKKIAVKTGTAAATYAESLKDKYNWTITTFDDSNNMFNDVTTGNSVACFEDEPIMKYAIATGVKLKIVTKPANGSYYAFAVKKGTNQELLAKFNAGLKKIKENGTYQKIVDYYLSDKTVQENKTEKTTVWTILKQNKTMLLQGLGMTILLSILGIIGATFFGVLVGLLGIMQRKWGQWLSETIIYIFRGLPLIVLALFVYTGIPALTGHKIPALVAGVITLSLNEGAYIAAFVKGGIRSVDAGQMEAARCLGLSYGKAIRKVVLPQGIRLMIPSFINQFIITLKDTSILSVIGLLELTQMGKIIIARNMEGFRVWAIIAVIYVVIITLLTWISNKIQKEMTK